MAVLLVRGAKAPTFVGRPAGDLEASYHDI